MPNLPVPLIASQRRLAWPKHLDAKPIPYIPLAHALTRGFSSDAHTAAYSVPSMPRRLSSEAVTRLPEGVTMHLFIADIDCPAVHGTSLSAPDEWWTTERAKLDALGEVYPSLFAYRTRGGYRLVGRLDVPIVLRTHEDTAVWTERYLCWVAYFRRRFDIHIDPACKDWQRLYRLPHATRTEGGQPESHDTLGNPYQVGIWNYDPQPQDIMVAQTLRPTLARQRQPRPPVRFSCTDEDLHGKLYRLFSSCGWVGPAIDAEKWAVQCPWEDLHTKGARFDTSTVLFAPSAGQSLGLFYCSHNHCQHRTYQDVLALFPDERTQPSLAQAYAPPLRSRLGYRLRRVHHG